MERAAQPPTKKPASTQKRNPVHESPAGVVGASPQEGATGVPLPAAMRRQMEQAFGDSFRDVRVNVSTAATDRGAEAFAQGNRVTVAPKAWAPGSGETSRVIAHELAHIQQQRAGRVGGKAGAVNDTPALEAEADRAATRVLAGRDAGVTGGSATMSADAAPVQLKRKGGSGARPQQPTPVRDRLRAKVGARREAMKGHVQASPTPAPEAPAAAAAGAAGGVAYGDVRAPTQGIRANRVGGSMRKAGWEHHHAIKETLGKRKAAGQMSAAEQTGVQDMLGGRKDMIDRAQLLGGKGAWQDMRTAAAGVPGPGEAATPAQEAIKARHQGLMEAKYGKVLMPQLLAARAAVKAPGWTPPPRGVKRPVPVGTAPAQAAASDPARPPPTVGTLENDQIKADLPMRGTGSENITSDIDVNSRGPFSSFALGNVNRVASASLASGGMAEGQTAGTSVDVNFYAQDYISAAAPELAGSPTEMKKDDSGSTTAFNMNEEVELSGADYAKYERDQRVASFAHLVRHIDPEADNLDIAHGGRELPAQMQRLLDRLNKEEDKQSLMQAWEQHTANQDKVRGKADEKREKLTAQLDEGRAGYAQTPEGADHLKRALVASSHQSLYEEAHGGEGGIGDQRLALRAAQGKANRADMGSEPGTTPEAAKAAVSTQGVNLKKKISEGLYFANEAYASQGAVHHAVGVAGLRKDQEQRRVLDGDTSQPQINMPKSGMLHTVIENAGDAFRVMREKEHGHGAGHGHAPKAYSGKEALSDSHKYINRMFDANALAGQDSAALAGGTVRSGPQESAQQRTLRSRAVDQFGAVKQVAGAHARVKAAESLSQENAGELKGADKERLERHQAILGGNGAESLTEVKRARDNVEKTATGDNPGGRGQSLPATAEELQNMLVDHVAESVNTFRPDAGEGLRFAPNQATKATKARAEEGAKQADRMSQLAALRRGT